MTDTRVTEIVCVVDRSGSMRRVMDEAIDGFNRFLDHQCEREGTALLTLTLFNDEVDVVCSGEPIQEVEPLTAERFDPKGMTALLDAVGESLEEVARREPGAAAPEDTDEDVLRPDQVLFVILTDGMENASREYLQADIPAMIEERRERDTWEFLFLAANIDAFQVAGHFNISPDHVDTFVNERRSVTTAFEKVTRAASSFRETGSVSEVWAEVEHEDTPNGEPE